MLGAAADIRGQDAVPQIDQGAQLSGAYDARDVGAAGRKDLHYRRPIGVSGRRLRRLRHLSADRKLIAADHQRRLPIYQDRNRAVGLRGRGDVHVLRKLFECGVNLRLQAGIITISVQDLLVVGL